MRISVHEFLSLLLALSKDFILQYFRWKKKLATVTFVLIQLIKNYEAFYILRFNAWLRRIKVLKKSKKEGANELLMKKYS